MPYGVHAYGVSPFLEYQGIPDKRIYNEIEFFGSTGGITIDDVHLLNYEMTLDEIIAEDISVQPIWTDRTLLLCYFNDNLNGGNITNITGNIDNWEVYRKELNDSAFTLLDTLLGTAEMYTDFTAQPYKTYTYEVVATNDIERSEPILGERLYICSYNDVLIDSVTGESHIFNLNLQEGESTNNVDFVKYEGINKYPSVVRGQRDYMSYAITAIPIYQTSTQTTYSQTSDYLDTLRVFINNPNDKILKTRKGFIYRGQTNGYRQSPLLNGIDPYIVSFEFYETGVI